MIPETENLHGLACAILYAYRVHTVGYHVERLIYLMTLLCIHTMTVEFTQTLQTTLGVVVYM